MISVEAARKEIIKRLGAVGIDKEEGTSEALLILEHLLDKRPAQQILHAQTTLTEEQSNQLEEILTRRAKRVPVQYCLGNAWFMGLQLLVKEGVFIPRVDTESLVEAGDQLLRQSGLNSPVLFEIGSGTGAISVALLQRNPSLQIVACDLNAEAVELTRQNAQRHGVGDRLTVVLGDWRNALTGQVHGFISNPPYIPLLDQETLQPEVRDYEPPLALFGTDADGLGFYREMADRLKSNLIDGCGFVAVEVGDGQSQPVSGIFSDHGWCAVTAHADVNGLPRVVSALAS